MCVCLTINARKKFRIKKSTYLTEQNRRLRGHVFVAMWGQTFLLVSRLTGATKRSFRSVRGNTPNHPITYSRPSQLSPGSTRSGSTLTRPCVNSSPVSTRPQVNSSSGQLVPGSTRTRVNSKPGQLVLESTHPRVNSPRFNSSTSQLVPVSHFVPESTRPRVNLSSSQLVPGSTRPGSTRDCTCPWSTCTHVNLHPRQLEPESSRNRVNSHPGQLAPRYLPITLPTYLSTFYSILFYSLLKY